MIECGSDRISTSQAQPVGHCRVLLAGGQQAAGPDQCYTACFCFIVKAGISKDRSIGKMLLADACIKAAYDTLLVPNRTPEMFEAWSANDKCQNKCL